MTITIVLLVGCSRSGPDLPAEPETVPLSIKSVEILGPGAKKAESSKAQIAEAAVGPVKTYYAGSYFNVDLSVKDFTEGFRDFTPTLAAIAQNAHKSTLTPDDPDIASLRAEQLEAKVSLFAEKEGGVDAGIVKVMLKGTGKLNDGSPLSLSHVDDFYVTKLNSRWVVTGYAVLQEIAAPPAMTESAAAPTGTR